MPRFSRRRSKRKPKARKRIDKVQNKRLTRLEESIEKKFAIHPVRQVTLTTSLGTASAAQIYNVLPALLSTTTDSTMDSLIGNQVSLKNVKVRFNLAPQTSGNFSARVIFFWNICPRTWSTSTTAAIDPPTSTAVQPTWNQLLNNVVLDGPTAGRNFNNSATARQEITKSNKSPIVVLSDKVYSFNDTGNSKGSITDSFSKSYKAMKLCYNQFSGSTASSVQPVNRILYMAVILDQLAGGTEPDPSTAYLSYSTVMHYTDA